MKLKSSSLPTILLTFFVVQIFLVSLTFPLAELFTQEPLLHIDNSVHWYRITVATNLAEIGNSTGYDPYFNAGTAIGVAENPAAKVPALLGSLLSPYLTSMQIWKIYVFIASCIAGLCTPVALGYLKQNVRVIVVAGTFGLLIWWCSIFRWYHTAGLVSFVLACYMTLPFLALIYRYLNGRGTWPYLVGTGLFGAFGMCVHPLFPLPVASWTLIYIGLNWRSVEKRRILALVTVVPAISVLPNLNWLYLMFIADPLTIRIPGITHQSHVAWEMIWTGLIGSSKGAFLGSKMYSLLAFGTLLANLLVKDKDCRKLVQAFTIAGVFWVLYAAFGASIKLLASLTQPNRFMPVGYLMLVIPAAFGAIELIARLAENSNRLTRVAITFSTCVVAVLTAANLNELRREISTAEIGHYGATPPEVRRIGPYSNFILEWLDENTEPTARILFETSAGRIHDGYHAASYLAYTTDREFIGGPYVYGYFANFTDGFLFGKNITELSVDDFRKYVDLYNLGWIISHSEQSKSYFDRIDWLTRMDTHDQITTYRIEREHSYFLEGEGQVVVRNHKKLVLDNLSGTEVVLKYHYMRGLVSEPVTTILPVVHLNDPNPFIRVENPPKKLTIYFE